jgi:hypothetical protein
MIGWLDTGKAEEFGSSLGQFFIEKMPQDAQLNESKMASKTQYLLDKMSVRINAFKREQKLNGYKNAKLANAFKWKLRDAGYDKAYIDTVVSWLVTRL